MWGPQLQRAQTQKHNAEGAEGAERAERAEGAEGAEGAERAERAERAEGAELHLRVSPDRLELEVLKRDEPKSTDAGVLGPLS